MLSWKSQQHAKKLPSWQANNFTNQPRYYSEISSLADAGTRKYQPHYYWVKSYSSSLDLALFEPLTFMKQLPYRCTSSALIPRCRYQQCIRYSPFPGY